MMDGAQLPGQRGLSVRPRERELAWSVSMLKRSSYSRSLPIRWAEKNRMERDLSVSSGPPPENI
jgi:hypothetical protein